MRNFIKQFDRITTGIIVDANGVEHFKIIISRSTSIILTLLILMLFVCTVLIALGAYNSFRIQKIEETIPVLQEELDKK